jgi:hypothetical protein
MTLATLLGAAGFSALIGPPLRFLRMSSRKASS